MTPPAMHSIERALAKVHSGIDEAALSAGRDPSEVTLIAVSKGFPAGAVEAALAAGQMDCGENRVQELAAKDRLIFPRPRWHFVGRLQRNKVRRVLSTGAVIHSVDRADLAGEIDRRAESAVRILVEVNVSAEPQKGGVEPEGVGGLVASILDMPNLDLIGLMTMAPKSRDPEAARRAFRELARLRREVADGYSCPRIRHLSMGMSQDYRIAVQEGATMVRVGEEIFGPRTPPRAFVDTTQIGESER